jgi:hypothetical protein
MTVSYEITQEEWALSVELGRRVKAYLELPANQQTETELNALTDALDQFITSYHARRGQPTGVK